MAKRQVVVAGILGLALLGGRSVAEAGPIGRKIQEWTSQQPQVYTAQPSRQKNLDLNLTQSSFSQRVRQRLPWRKSSVATSGYQIKTEYMKHRNDGTLVH